MDDQEDDNDDASIIEEEEFNDASSVDESENSDYDKEETYEEYTVRNEKNTNNCIKKINNLNYESKNQVTIFEFASLISTRTSQISVNGGISYCKVPGNLSCQIGRASCRERV